MNEQREQTDSPSAGLSGTFSLGGELALRRLGFGAMRITGEGIWGPPKDPDSALRVLRRSVELGVNFIDTADSYGPNVSEELIAKALAPYPADLVIATKGGWKRPWSRYMDPRRQSQALARGCRRQFKEIACRTNRRLPATCARSCSAFSRLCGDSSGAAGRRQNSICRPL
jgi:aryl-alcohol dehydrogenase-like predicted oxidoreductase